MLRKNKKSQKDNKTRGTPSQPMFSISNPANTLVRPGPAFDGLYMKLTSHQSSIATQIKFITAAMEDNGHAQYRSRHKKVDLTAVVTALLVQVDCAVTTAHQCLNKDILDKDDSIKPKLEDSQKKIYQDVAFLVRWIDFDSKGAGREMPAEREKISDTIKSFEVALAEVVRLVYQCQLQNGTTSTPSNHQRRNSLDSGLVNTARKNSGGPQDSPVVGGEDGSHKGHPTVENLRMENRKSGSPSAPFRNKANTLMPMMHSRDSGQSEGSSGGASDEERRRSGSSDHYLSGGQSPEHFAHGRESMSPDWDSSRHRTMTAPVPVDNAYHYNTMPHPHHSSAHQSMMVGPMAHPVPITAPLAPHLHPEAVASSLPPLPGETMSVVPPPLPLREEVRGEREEVLPPLPTKNKGATLPRMSSSGSMQMNGHLSPEADRTHSHVPSEETDGGEVPPPIPVKKRNMSQSQPNGLPNQAMSPADGEVPPPIPGKRKNQQRASLTSPVTTPIHSHTLPRNLYNTNYVDSPMHALEPQGGGAKLDLPPVPLRMESILGAKAVTLGQDPAPPKPPRNDRPDRPSSIERPSLPASVSQELEALNAVRNYNDAIRKAKELGPDVAPPVPLKKKTIMIYKGLVKGYEFDESFVQPLIIEGMEAPPPIPPKKRRQRKAPPADPSQNSSDSAQMQRQDSQSRPRSNEDVEEAGEIEVNHLECEDAQGYLVFSEEAGGYTLDGGPVDALIAYAASSAKSVKHFSEAFLLTYYTFITPAELITKLLYRLNFFYGSNPTSLAHGVTAQSSAAVWQTTTSLLVRVLTGLKQPLTKECQKELIDLVHMMITNGNLKFAQLLRNALVEKLNQLCPDNAASITLGAAFSTSTQRKMSIMEFSAEAIARQMTVLDNELFQKVDVCEMLYWAKEQSEEKSPMLTQFTLHFNNVSQWTKATLLKRGLDNKARCKLMNHFIAIMKSLLDSFNNFNSYLAILSAIESSPISRLDWPDKILKGLEEPRQLIDNRGSFKNYREAFKQAKPPCIPYIGLYLQDLTFIEMQPSKLDGDPLAINFTKRWKQFKSVDHIRFAQTKQYHFDPDPELLSLFKNFEVKETDEDLWSISTEIKPSQRSARTNTA